MTTDHARLETLLPVSQHGVRGEGDDGCPFETLGLLDHSDLLGCLLSGTDGHAGDT